MENKNISNNLFLLQRNESNALGYNKNFLEHGYDVDFDILGKAYEYTGRSYAKLTIAIENNNCTSPNCEYERKQLKKQGLAVNKAGQVVDAKDKRKKASADKLAAAMKKFPNYGKIAKIAGKLGPVGKILTGAFLVNELISGKSPAELAPQIAGLFTGLVGAGIGATAGAAIGTALFPGIGTVAGLAAGTILGGLSGDILGTALTEYILDLPLSGKIGSLHRRFSKGSVDNATTPDARSSMGSYGQAAVSSGGSGGGSPNLAPVTKDASAVTPTGGSVDDFGGVGNIINNNQIIDASSRSNTSSYQLGNGAVTSGNGLLKAVSESL